MAKVIVTGGCGYIGSHTVVELIEQGYDVVSIDNYSRSEENTSERIKSITGKKIFNYKTDLKLFADTYAVFEQHRDAEAVIHFAAYKSVGESMDNPLMYYDNNINSLLNILKSMEAFNMDNLIFSSSCAVYGNSKELPVTETTKWEKAESPYGYTKQISEQIIEDFTKTNTNFRSINLRYFNPAGAHESGLLGESPTVVNTQLVPLITETAIGKRKELKVFGDKYDTRDGSCIRDYIHIMDLADAHVKSVQRLTSGASTDPIEAYNLGIGNGITVFEALNAFEKVNSVKVNYTVTPARNGDVAAIFSNHKLASEKLGWKPNRTIEEIMKSAWLWEQNKNT